MYISDATRTCPLCSTFQQSAADKLWFSSSPLSSAVESRCRHAAPPRPSVIWTWWGCDIAARTSIGHNEKARMTEMLQAGSFTFSDRRSSLTEPDLICSIKPGGSGEIAIMSRNE